MERKGLLNDLNDLNDSNARRSSKKIVSMFAFMFSFNIYSVINWRSCRDLAKGAKPCWTFMFRINLILRDVCGIIEMLVFAVEWSNGFYLDFILTGRKLNFP